ncbi:MAG: 16S rRNA (guanine(966)-N(2))-methyltransferase [Candidatus Phytoplasma cynodontis]|uniref:16S rRNA (guanine(966)-N(2))-methyltransferase RsmD n=1 Tax='Cynodon dactylon' phytoplasma TaxID=295320 RepID=UPI001265CD30|nr:16S rRNA (guanine(966)-N(2))-methyltransferase RsmD ['Cynodon dactylon' phytoplasma]KAB8121891.1 16S rRNA (guanine(966)-N(2))-methyltransferase RsmD ['Cynodon dactylon' phytoplasma]WIA07781.1 MAG: 16S rRNA (guanine(966)-N(2))-methyltransferase [Candidatus Phytoplasma cynodontis]
MIHIIKGKYKNFKLKMVSSKKTKMTSHLIRKSLFDTIGDLVKNATLLDLFSGSGCYGFEALSRGAKEIYLVDNSFCALKTIYQNKKKLNLKENEIQIFYSDAFKILKKFIKNRIKFDIIILDPPYFSNYYYKLFKNLDKITHSHSIVICELYYKNDLLPKIGNFYSLKTKKYGNKLLKYYNIKID